MGRNLRMLGSPLLFFAIAKYMFYLLLSIADSPVQENIEGAEVLNEELEGDEQRTVAEGSFLGLTNRW